MIKQGLTKTKEGHYDIIRCHVVGEMCDGRKVWVKVLDDNTDEQYFLYRIKYGKMNYYNVFVRC